MFIFHLSTMTWDTPVDTSLDLPPAINGMLRGSVYTTDRGTRAVFHGGKSTGFVANTAILIYDPDVAVATSPWTVNDTSPTPPCGFFSFRLKLNYIARD